MKHSTREEWLMAAFKALCPRMKPHGKIPKTVHILASFPYNQKRAIGMQFSSSWTEDKSTYIAISPVLGQGEITELLGTLVHEIIHAILPAGSKHGKDFKKVALALGLKGRMKATENGPELEENLKALAKELGPYPHTTMIAPKTEKKPAAKKQILRFVSPEVEGYSAWVTPAVARDFGPPLCPSCKKVMVLA